MKILLRLLALAVLLCMAACSLQEVIPMPTPWVFPTLTPRPTGTPAPTLTGVPTPTFSPTPPQPAGIGTPLPVHAQALTVENAAAMTLLAQRGNGIPQQMRLSPDGRLLGVAATRGIFLYDAHTLAEVAFLATDSPAACLAFSDDGSLLAVGTGGGALRLWSLPDLTEIRQWQSGFLPLLEVAFSPDGSLLAAAAWDRTVTVWNVADGAQSFAWQARQRPLAELSFSADGLNLLGWAVRESVQVWRLETGRAVDDLYVGEDELGRLPVSAAFSDDRAWFASNHARRIRLFRTRNGTTLRLFRDLDEDVRSLALAPDGSRLAALEQTHIQVWDSASGARLARIQLPQGASLRVLMAFSADGETLYTLDSALQAWSLADTAEPSGARPAEFSSSTLLDVALQEEEGLLMTGALDGSLQRVALEDGSAQETQALPSGALESLALAPAAGLALSVSLDEGARLWEIEEAALAASLQGQRGRVTCAAFSPDGSLAVTGAEDGTLRIWDTAAGAQQAVLQLNAVPQEARFAGGNSLLGVRVPGEVQVWDAADEALLFRTAGYAFALSGDGRLLAAAVDENGSRLVRFYRLPGGEEAGEIAGGSAALALSWSGDLLAMGGAQVSVWSTHSGRQLTALEGQAGSLLLFTADDRLLLQAGWDGAWRAWGVP